MVSLQHKSATENLGKLPAGTLCTTMRIGGCQLVRVKGQDAPEDKVYVHHFDSAQVVELPADEQAAQYTLGKVAGVALTLETPVGGHTAPRNVTLGALPVGGLFWYDGKLHLRVAFSVEAPANSVWVRDLNSEWVIPLLLNSVVEREHGELVSVHT